MAGALLGLLMLVTRRTRRQLALDTGHDLSRLLQGALQQPEAFRSVPAVFQRPLVPTARGRALSLDEARALASQGHLYRTRGHELARRAVVGGAHVLEDSSPEARTVADALGAIDLDPWDPILADADASETPLLTAVNAALRDADERLHVLAVAGASEEVKSLDLAPPAPARHPLAPPPRRRRRPRQPVDPRRRGGHADPPPRRRLQRPRLPLRAPRPGRRTPRADPPPRRPRGHPRGRPVTTELLHHAIREAAS